MQLDMAQPLSQLDSSTNTGIVNYLGLLRRQSSEHGPDAFAASAATATGQEAEVSTPVSLSKAVCSSAGSSTILGKRLHRESGRAYADSCGASVSEEATMEATNESSFNRHGEAWTANSCGSSEKPCKKRVNTIRKNIDEGEAREDIKSDACMMNLERNLSEVFEDSNSLEYDGKKFEEATKRQRTEAFNAFDNLPTISLAPGSPQHLPAKVIIEEDESTPT